MQGRADALVCARAPARALSLVIDAYAEQSTSSQNSLAGALQASVAAHLPFPEHINGKAKLAPKN